MRESERVAGKSRVSGVRRYATAGDWLLCLLIYILFYPLDKGLILPGLSRMLERQCYGLVFPGLAALLTVRITVLLYPSFFVGWKADRHAAFRGLLCLPVFLATYTLLSLLVSAATGRMMIQAGLTIRPSAGNPAISMVACAALFSAVGVVGCASRKEAMRRASRRCNRKNAVG